MDKNKEHLISVIVPVYNVEKYIKKCIQSLSDQTYKNLEIIIVNDGSPDNSEGIIRGLQKKDKRIKLINQNNFGVSMARNAGLDVAKGEYVVFVDSDDYVAGDYVEYLYNLIRSYDADFAYSTELFKSRYDEQVQEEDVKVVSGEESAGILLSPDVTVGSYNKIYSRSVIEKYRLRFNTDLYYGEGLNFIIRMSLVSRKVIVGNKKVLFYRRNNALSATTMYNIEKYHNGLKSLQIVGGIINRKNKYVDSMYRLHLSTFYLGAIASMIENREVGNYRRDYRKWKKNLRSEIGFIMRNKYVPSYRKATILVGAFFPYLVAMLNKRRKRMIMNNSVK